MRGWAPTTTRMTTSSFVTLQAVTNATALPTAPLWGNTNYNINDCCVNIAGGPLYAPGKIFSSAYPLWSYGRNFTTSDYAGLSWSYVAGSNIIRMDATTLGYMFPGLIIILNN